RASGTWNRSSGRRTSTNPERGSGLTGPGARSSAARPRPCWAETKPGRSRNERQIPVHAGRHRGDCGMIDDDASAADPLGQIADEFVEAFRQGKHPSVEEYARRYPDHADQIRDMLPALVLMEKAKAAEGYTPGQRSRAKASAFAAPLQQLGDYLILREVGRG